MALHSTDAALEEATTALDMLLESETPTMIALILQLCGQISEKVENLNVKITEINQTLAGGSVLRRQCVHEKNLARFDIRNPQCQNFGAKDKPRHMLAIEASQ